MKRNFIIFIFILVVFQLKAQIVSNGNLQIIQDNSIDNLIEKHLKINQLSNTFPGFRINIYFQSGNNSKANAYLFKTTFNSKFPDIEAYVVYDEPNFKVKVGDFRTRMEARGFLKQIKTDFPDAFVIKDQINLPKIK